MSSAEFEYLEEGTLLGGRYQIQRPLGAGAMGAVYQAIHTVTRQQVAVKVLFRHVAAAMGGVERFRREVRVAGSIKHPGVVEITDAGEDNGLLFYAMELLEGAPMDVWLARQPPREEALEILLEGVDALAAVHRAGAVHRDIKPENFFVLRHPRGPRVKLLDFGIVRDGEAMRATQTGYTLGTPLYMAPEQALNPSEAQPSADVWSLGIMLYEILCGEAPFLGETAQAVCIRSIQEEHAPVLERAPDTPPALAAFVDRCLAKHPDARPADASAFYAELQVALRAPAPLEPTSLPEPEDLDLPPAGPPRGLLIALAALALLITGLTVALVLSMSPEEDAPELDPRDSAAALDAPVTPPASAAPQTAAEPLAAAEPPASAPLPAEAPSAPDPDAEAPSAEAPPDEAASAQPTSASSAAPADARRSSPPEVSRRAAPASAEAPPTSAAQAPPAELAPAAPPASTAPPSTAPPATAPPATAPPASAPPATAPASPKAAPPATAAPPVQDAAPPATAAPKRRGSGFVTF